MYIALGDPDEKRDVTTADTTRTTWIYRTYWQQYEGSAWVGWHRVIVATPRGYAVFHEPITGRLSAERLQRLFGMEAAERVHSAAVIPLGGTGLLALGSASPDHFQPGMGTLFLKMIGAAVGAALARPPRAA